MVVATSAGWKSWRSCCGSCVSTSPAHGITSNLPQLCPNETRFKELLTSLDGNRTSPVGDIAQRAHPNVGNLEVVDSVIRSAEGNSDTTRLSTNPQDQDDLTFDIADSLGRIVLGAPNSSRFLGKLSEEALVQAAVELKKKYTSDEDARGNPQKSDPMNKRDEFWKAKPVCENLRISFTALTFF